MDKETLGILADAISEIGVRQWWQTGEDGIQLEFGGVMQHDETKAEKAPPFQHDRPPLPGKRFCSFYGRSGGRREKQWYERLRDDEIGYCPVETFDLCFDVIGFAKTALDNYRNRTTIMGSQAAELSGRGKHILAAKCEDVGFFAGLLALEKEQKCL